MVCGFYGLLASVVRDVSIMDAGMGWIQSPISITEIENVGMGTHVLLSCHVLYRDISF